MSLTNVKDLDVLICKYLDDKDLINFSLVNNHYNEIFNNRDLWVQKILDLNIKNEYLCKELNKDYYIELNKALKDEDFVKVIYYSILENRCDIVSLIFRKRNLDPNYIFFFKDYRCLDIKKAYYSLKEDVNLPYQYCPINLSIKKAYYPMWEYFKLNYKLVFTPEIYIVAIASKNKEIFKDVLNYDNFFEIEHWILEFSVRSYNLDSTRLILERISEKELYNMLNFMVTEYKREYNNWFIEYNYSFLEVLKKSNLEYVKEISRNNEEFEKLLNFYHK